MTTAQRWVLAIDTATDQAGIAFFDGSQLLERSWPAGRQQTTELLPQMQSLAGELNIDLGAIGLVVVAIGPGSFTGLRVGLSVAKGLVLASGCALVGVPTLDITAGPYRQAGLNCIAVAPAGRGRVVWACYAGETVTTPINASFTEFQHAVAAYPGVLIAGELDSAQRDLLAADSVHLASIAAGNRRPGVLAEYGRARWLAGDVDDPTTLEPAYLHGRPNPR